MKRFRVSVEKVMSDMRNPFLAFKTAESFEGATTKVLVRTWEFEAKDEQEVRKLFAEAKQQGIEGVKGMRIRSIQEI